MFALVNSPLFSCITVEHSDYISVIGYRTIATLWYISSQESNTTDYYSQRDIPINIGRLLFCNGSYNHTVIKYKSCIVNWK